MERENSQLCDNQKELEICSIANIVIIIDDYLIIFTRILPLLTKAFN